MTDFLNFIWNYYPWGVFITCLACAWFVDAIEDDVPKNLGFIVVSGVLWPLWWCILVPIYLGMIISTWLKNR